MALTLTLQSNIYWSYSSAYFSLYLLKSLFGTSLKSLGQEWWIMVGTHWYELLCSASTRIYMHCNRTLNAPHHALSAGEQLILKMFPFVSADHYLVKLIQRAASGYRNEVWNGPLEHREADKIKISFFLQARLLLQQFPNLLSIRYQEVAWYNCTQVDIKVKNNTNTYAKKEDKN